MEPVPRWETVPHVGERQEGTESEHRLGIRPTWAHTMALTLKLMSKPI